MTTRIGVDIGGTFADLVFYDDASKRTIARKVLTGRQSPVMECVAGLEESGPGSGGVETCKYFLHGTTVGLNTLLERSGARVGLLCTKGVRDVLELRTGSRQDIYDLMWRPTEGLVPRHLRCSVSERVLFDGSVHLTLEQEDVRRAYRRFVSEGVESIAIAFLHAYANPVHELEAARLLRAAGWTGHISLSHEVSGEYREYPRTITTVIDAYVKRRLCESLEQIEQDLRHSGFRGQLLISRCGGGAMSFEQGKERAFETITSGPVAGAEGAAQLARALRLERVIAADVGGTSFDTCIIENGRTPLLQLGEIAGFPVQAPWVDIRSIGAGGGSIARVDNGGLLCVGPSSAGSAPGPACYDRGGANATPTDASLFLGLFGRDRLGESFVLSVAKAESALTALGRKIGLSAMETAIGILRVATAHMANAIREITVGRGLDPRTMCLLAYGGAGPQMASQLARELGIGTIIVPPFAGNFSAWGLLSSDVVRARSSTRIVPLRQERMPEVAEVLEGLFASLPGESVGHEGTGAFEKEAVVDVRYKGQEHSLPIVVSRSAATALGIDAVRIRDMFLEAYQRTFGSTLGDKPLEIVAIRATVKECLPACALGHLRDEQCLRQADSCKAYSFAEEKTLTFGVFNRAGLQVDEEIDGPAIILESTTSTFLDAGSRARVDQSGCLMIDRRA